MNIELTKEMETLVEKYNSPEDLLQISDFLFNKDLLKHIVTPEIFSSIMHLIYKKPYDERYKYLEILREYINVEVDTSYSIEWD